ncbi:MAG: SecY-interacting protein Syd [Pseudomonadales bacterium]
MTRTVAEALDDFLAHASQSTERLLAPYQPDLRSPCETGPPIDPEHELVTWQPVRQDNPRSSSAARARLRGHRASGRQNLVGALLAGPLAAEATEGPLTLLQLWAPDDAERLAENLIGHAFSRQRLKAPELVLRLHRRRTGPAAHRAQRHR